MRPEQQSGDVPQFQLGEKLELQITSIEETTGRFGKQLQIDGTMPAKNGWRGRAWIKYYPTPAPNQYLGKLCLAIERVNKQTYQNLNSAIDAIRSHGKIYVEVKGFNTVAGKNNPDGTPIQYPKFAVFADTLPGEQPQQMFQPPTGMKPPVNLNAPKPNAVANTLTTQTYQWLIVSQSDIGQVIDDATWNQMVNLGVAQELGKYGLIEYKDQYPVLSEKCREFL